MLLRSLRQSRPPYSLHHLIRAALRPSYHATQHRSGLRGTKEGVEWSDLGDLKLAHVACYLHDITNHPDGLESFIQNVLAIKASIDAEMKSAYVASGKPYPPPNEYPGPKSKDVILYWLVRVLRPQLFIETGVDQGVSSRFILQALSENGAGFLISMDPASVTASGRPVGWLVPADLRSRWTFLNQTSQRTLEALTDRPDIFLHDSLHTYEQMLFEFRWALQRLRPGGLILSDDINENFAFRDFTLHYANRLTVLSSAVFGIAKCLSVGHESF